MNPPDPENLLNDILTGDDHAEFRRRSLEHGIAALRQRMRRRRILQAGALAALPCLLALAVLPGILRHRPAPQTVIATHTAPTRPAAELPPVKTINDEQLFALFPGRAMALIGTPGNQQLVFLDHPDSAPSN